MSKSKIVLEKLLSNKEMSKYVLDVKNQIEDLEPTKKGVYRISLPPYDIIIFDRSVE